MSTLRGEVWSKVLTGVRYRAGGSTMEEQFAREEARASAICDDILAAVAEALTSDDTLAAIAEAWDASMDDPNDNGGDLMMATLTAALRAVGIVNGSGA